MNAIVRYGSAVPSRGLITISIMLATVMQALDTTIANVALPHMQGSFSASQDQIAWVLTSYIVAAAIMTPPTGVLAARLGRKRLFLWAVGGFTLSSMLCGAATSLDELIVFRLLQGVFGAGLVPLSQAVLLDTYPRERHGSAMAMWGVGVMVGPILGPTLGGWLTEYYNWRWVFYINVPFGALALLGILTFVPETARDRSRPFDFFGFALLSLAIGALQLMLDRGELKDWFGSAEILSYAAIAGVGLYMFVLHMFTAERPFLDPALFRDRNLVTGLFFIFLVSIVLLATLALLPPFLQDLMGYPVLTTGLVLAPRGIGTMIAMMLVGRLIGRVDARAFIVLGLLLTAQSLWAMAGFTTAISEGAHRAHGCDARPRARVHLRAPLDPDLRHPAGTAAHRSRRTVQPDAQHRQQHRHLDRRGLARAQHPGQPLGASRAHLTAQSAAPRPAVAELEPRQRARAGGDQCGGHPAGGDDRLPRRLPADDVCDADRHPARRPAAPPASAATDPGGGRVADGPPSASFRPIFMATATGSPFGQWGISAQAAPKAHSGSPNPPSPFTKGGIHDGSMWARRCGGATRSRWMPGLREAGPLSHPSKGRGSA
jgi:EmrB/QacA subfamily drug resistance transporter